MVCCIKDVGCNYSCYLNYKSMCYKRFINLIWLYVVLIDLIFDFLCFFVVDFFFM